MLVLYAEEKLKDIKDHLENTMLNDFIKKKTQGPIQKISFLNFKCIPSCWNCPIAVGCGDTLRTKSCLAWTSIIKIWLNRLFVVNPDHWLFLYLSYSKKRVLCQCTSEPPTRYFSVDAISEIIMKNASSIYMNFNQLIKLLNPVLVSLLNDYFPYLLYNTTKPFSAVEIYNDCRWFCL